MSELRLRHCRRGYGRLRACRTGCRPTAAHRVLLLEAGPRDAYPWIHVPIGYAKTMFHPVYNWRFKTEPEPE